MVRTSISWQSENQGSVSFAAVIAAADALTGISAGAGIFRDIPGHIDPGPPVDPESCGCDPDSASTAITLGKR